MLMTWRVPASITLGRKLQSCCMRVHGALMWSLGKVFRSPEVRAVRFHAVRINAHGL